MIGPYVLAAGGTGGHLFPAQALARELIRRGRSVVVMTDHRGRSYTSAFPGAAIATVPSATLSGRSVFGKVAAVATIGIGIAVARLKLAKLRPRAVVGFGGYPSLPVMLAAIGAGRPTLVHEQNAVPGRVNRLLINRVTRVAASLPFARFAPKNVAKVNFTGNPVRPEVSTLASQAYQPPTPTGLVHLLIFGGSQGARALSELVPAALAQMPLHERLRLRVVQQCRPEDIGAVKDAYSAAGIAAEIAPFFADLPQRMADSQLVIARAGASTISELAVIGRPAILIPYPHAMDDHQAANAAILERAGAAWTIRESELDAAKLRAVLETIFAEPAALVAHARAAHELGRPQATQALADLVEGIGA